MTKTFTAGERLAPVASHDRARAGKSPPPPPNNPPPDRPGREPGRQPKRRSKLGFVRQVLAVLMGLVFLATGVAGFVGWAAWRHYNTGLPDVDGLRTYQPRVMSRIYAGDSRLLAELATERRIFVPYSAIPDLVKHAFVSAEDQNFFTHPGVDPVAMFRRDAIWARTAADRRLDDHAAGCQEHAARQ